MSLTDKENVFERFWVYDVWFILKISTITISHSPYFAHVHVIQYMLILSHHTLLNKHSQLQNMKLTILLGVFQAISVLLVTGGEYKLL